MINIQKIKPTLVSNLRKIKQVPEKVNKRDRSSINLNLKKIKTKKSALNGSNNSKARHTVDI